QIVQKNLEEKQLEEEQAVKAQNWKLPVYYDDDDDEESSNSLEDNIISELPPYSSIAPNEPKQEEKNINEEQAANARYWKIPACCDDDDDYNSAITPNEPVNSLNIGDEHLDTIPATKSDEFINSCVKNLVPNPSESEGENGCDVPACFTNFSNILFNADYESYSGDYQSSSDEDFPKEIFLKPLFQEEIIL
nr:hypothetical protein [Tanacetum cinerariifolium]